MDVSQQGALFLTEALSFCSKEYLLIPRLGCMWFPSTGLLWDLYFFAFFPVYEFLPFFNNSFAMNLLLIQERESLNVSAALCRPFLGSAGGPIPVSALCRNLILQHAGVTHPCL